MVLGHARQMLSLRVLLSFCLFFCQFQPGVAYKKKRVYYDSFPLRDLGSRTISFSLFFCLLIIFYLSIRLLLLLLLLLFLFCLLLLFCIRYN